MWSFLFLFAAVVFKHTTKLLLKICGTQVIIRNQNACPWKNSWDPNLLVLKNIWWQLLLLMMCVQKWQKMPHSESVNDKYMKRGLWPLLQMWCHASLRLHVFWIGGLISCVWDVIWYLHDKIFRVWGLCLLWRSLKWPREKKRVNS